MSKYHDMNNFEFNICEGFPTKFNNMNLIRLPHDLCISVQNRKTQSALSMWHLRSPAMSANIKFNALHGIKKERGLQCDMPKLIFDIHHLLYNYKSIVILNIKENT